MPYRLPPLRFTGAEILRDGELQDRSVAIANGLITRGPLPEIDFSGYYILPGIVDMQSHALQNHLTAQPKGATVGQALRAAEQEIAATGATTAWLTQHWSWEGGARSPEFAESLLARLDRMDSGRLLDLRMQLRAETHLIDEAPRLMALIRHPKANYVVFSNRLEDAMERLRAAPQLLNAEARAVGRTPDEHRAVIRQTFERARDVPRTLCQLAEDFDRHGVHYGSYLDASGEVREHYAMIGAKICESPASRRAAGAARAMSDPVVASASDLLLRPSDARAMSTAQLLSHDLCDALVSGGYSYALIHAFWHLVDWSDMDFAKAWALISAKPAEIMRMPDRGNIAPGRRADLVFINKESRRIEATVSDGCLSFVAGDAAYRFISANLTNHSTAIPYAAQ